MLVPVMAGLIVAGGALVVAHLVNRRAARGDGSVDAYSEIVELQQSLKQELDGLCTRLEALDRRQASGDGGGLQADLTEAKLLDAQVSQDESDYRGLSSIDLDVKLMEMLAVALRTSMLTNKYGGANVMSEIVAAAPPADLKAPIADLAA